MNSNKEGRRRELRRGGTLPDTNGNGFGTDKQKRIPADTMITTGNSKLLFTQQSWNLIANKVSRIAGRKLLGGEVEAIKNFIAHLPETNYYQMTYGDATSKIAGDFVGRNATKLGMIREENLDEHISRIDRDTDSGGIVDYQKKELLQFTPDENAFKYAVFADRRGNAIIDRDRVNGERSSPDNILPLSSVKNQYLTNQETFKGMKLLQSFLDPESVESMMARFQGLTTNYYNINLFRQIIQFDSRNRLPTGTGSTAFDYSWNIHNSAITGQIGSIRIQDTIQQIIMMTLYPFWAPVNSTTLNIYDEFRLLIKEFSSQSTTSFEFNDADQSVPTAHPYHFQLRVQKLQGDRMYLVPVQREFKFRAPMARAETITTQFRTPFEHDMFDPDSGIFTVTFANPTLFTITNPAVHLLNTGDLIYVYNLDSSSSSINNEINRKQGQIITKLSATQFTIAVDSSAISGTETGVHVYYGSKRVYLQIEFTSLEQ
jgi:hypothetical protein